LDYIKYILEELTGEISPEDARALDHWKRASKDNLQLYREIVKTWELTGQLPTDFSREKQQVRSLLQIETHPGKKKIGLYLKLSIAAVILLLIGVGLKSWNAQDIGHRTPKSLAYYSEEQSKEITLPDGTKMLLEPNTTVKLDTGFNLLNRNLYLSGGAFFDVEKNASLPFVIHSDGFKVEVLGTAFYISDKDEYGRAKVSVVRGLVKVQSGKEESKLHPGETLVIATKEHVLTHVPFKLDFIQLPSAPILFDHTPITDVAQALEKRFEVHIKLKGNPSKCSFTGSFDKESLDQIIRILKKAVGLHSQKMKPDQYTWIVRRCD